VFIDESDVNTYLQREYGRAPRGESIAEVKPGHHVDRVNGIGLWVTATIMVLNVTSNEPMVSFEHWFVPCLLAAIPKGFTAIMDNAKFHRKSVLRKPTLYGRCCFACKLVHAQWAAFRGIG
ncbi:MAG: transposase, partial [Spirochaetaceae bacterium]|nr:transposase [Spirochaetaceae bacterium]